MSTKIEFAVQMTCESCVSAVKKSLDGVPGINNIDINLEKCSVVVETTLSTTDVHQRLDKSGRKAVVKGYGGSLAGVAMLDTGRKEVQGVVRFVQVDPDTCIIDGTIDGLKPGNHRLTIHECGDMSKGCESVGDCFNPNDIQSNKNERVYGNLGNISANDSGRAVFRLEDKVVKLLDVIGRSLVVSSTNDNNVKENRLTCGIIARSAGLFQNPKMICACDGISIWDERSTPKSTL